MGKVSIGVRDARPPAGAGSRSVRSSSPTPSSSSFTSCVRLDRSSTVNDTTDSAEMCSISIASAISIDSSIDALRAAPACFSRSSADAVLRLEKMVGSLGMAPSSLELGEEEKSVARSACFRAKSA